MKVKCKKQRIIGMISFALIFVMVYTLLPAKTLAKETGKYPVRAGVILVTPDNDNKKAKILKLGHAGIILAAGKCVEADNPKVRTSSDKWRNRKHVKKLYGLDVKSTTKAQDRNVAKWCNKQVGKPYNFDFTNVNTRKKFYCSHLVWAGFKDNYKINLDTPKYGKMIAPMELENTKKTDTVYKYVK